MPQEPSKFAQYFHPKLPATLPGYTRLDFATDAAARITVGIVAGFASVSKRSCQRSASGVAHGWRGTTYLNGQSCPGHSWFKETQFAGFCAASALGGVIELASGNRDGRAAEASVYHK